MKKQYCVCKDSHINCPGGIETAICAYCKKPPYSVYKMLKDKLSFLRCPECKSPNIKFKNNKSVGHYPMCILK